MEVEYYRGNAVIDEQLNIQAADENFNAFLGGNAVYKLARSIHPSDVARLEEAISTIGIDERNIITVRMVRHDGRYRWMLMSLEDSKSGDEQGRYINIEIQDIAKFQETIEVLRGNNDRYMEYFSLMEYLMFSYDVHTDKLKIFMMGSHQQINFYNGTLVNWKASKLANKDIDVNSQRVFEELCNNFVTGAASFEQELKMCLFEEADKKDWCQIKGKTITDPHGRKHVIATMSIVNPVNNRVDDASTITGMRDAGTDILNKRSITNYVQRLLAQRPEYPITIAIIDIDDFKGINDRFGHMVGDEVIRAVADILKEAVEGKGVAGRIGGDEMLIVVEDLRTDEDIRSVLRTIRNNIAWLYNNQEDRPNITCSIGSATYPQDAMDYESLFKIADELLYLAKEKGKNRYIIFRDDLHGDYINGRGMPKNEEYAFYKYRKIGVVNSITNMYYKDGTKCILEAAQKIALTFSLDSIFIYERMDNGSWHRIVLHGEETTSKHDCKYLVQDNYIADFTEDGIEVIDNINFFERRAKTAHKAFTDMGICQAIQFIVSSYKDGSRIVSFNRNKQMSKWSEMDIMYLAVLGNILGMGFEND